jgi:hypothetical protein
MPLEVTLKPQFIILYLQQLKSVRAWWGRTIDQKMVAMHGSPCAPTTYTDTEY